MMEVQVNPSPLTGEGRAVLATQEPRRSWETVSRLQGRRGAFHPLPAAIRQQAAKSSLPSPVKGEG